jgi:dimethylargininase
MTRDVSPDMERCELTFLDRVPIDLEKARKQHDLYGRLLEDLGCRVSRLPAAEGCPDCCFIEDAAIVLDETAVITMMGALSRRPESQGVFEALQTHRRRIHTMALPATVDGGDVLHLGRRLFVGLSARSNEAGVRFLQEALGRDGYDVAGVRLEGCLHLKSAVTALGPDRVLLNPRFLDPALLPGVSWLPVPPEEPWAGNILRIGEGVVVHSGFERTIRLLEAEGLRVHPLDVSEFLKAEAGLTCKSLIFEAEVP